MMLCGAWGIGMMGRRTAPDALDAPRAATSAILVRGMT